MYVCGVRAGFAELSEVKRDRAPNVQLCRLGGERGDECRVGDVQCSKKSQIKRS